MRHPVGTLDRSHTEARAAFDSTRCLTSESEPQQAGRRVAAGRIARVGARGRLEYELRSIALDLLGPNESGEFSPGYTEWVATATGAAVSKVCDAALDALVEGLDSLLDDVPPDVVRQLQRARLRHEVGFA
jgi:hypothetical protein